MKHWSDILKDMGACRSARRFAKRYETPQAAWDACTVAPWMEWLCFIIGKYMFRGRDQRPSTRLDKAHKSKTHKAKRFWRKRNRMFYQWFYRPDQRMLADVIRKLWPKAPKLPKTWRKR